MSGKERFQKAVAAFDKSWDKRYESLPKGHEMLFRYHLAYQPSIYPEYFYLYDAFVFTIVSNNFKMIRGDDTLKKTVMIQTTVNNQNLSIAVRTQKEQQKIEIKELSKISLEGTVLEKIASLLENKLKKTSTMLLDIRDINNTLAPIGETKKQALVDYFKSSPEHLFLVVLFCNEKTLKELSEYIVSNHSALFSMLDDYKKLKTELPLRYGIKKEGLSDFDAHAAANADAFFQAEIKKHVHKIDIMYDAYLSIYLDKTLTFKKDVKKRKI